MGWLLNIVYAALLAALAPVLLYRLLMQGKYRRGWKQKLLGKLPQRDSAKPCIWLHAVSVGEVMQLKPVLEALTTKRAEFEFVISTTTSTGMEVALAAFPDHTVVYYPLDFTWAVSRALDQIRPLAIVLVELELWPNMIHAAARRGIPVTLINGRISSKSFQGYRRLRKLLKQTLDRLTLIAVQNDTYAERVKQLGAPSERVHVTGSIKFDSVETNRQNCKTAEIRSSFGLADDDCLFIAGSTQSPEERFALQTYLSLRNEQPNLRLVLVPRHKERFDEVAQLVKDYGLPMKRRSELLRDRRSGDESSEPPVLLLDTLGELAACWGMADIAFVGGSLTNRGGQNMIEPAGYGAAVLFGPNTQNFRDVVDILLSHDAAREISDAAELTTAVKYLLDTPADRLAMGRRAQRLVLAQQGATERTVELICTSLAAADNDMRTALPRAA